MKRPALWGTVTFAVAIALITWQVRSGVGGPAPDGPLVQASAGPGPHAGTTSLSLDVDPAEGADLVRQRADMAKQLQRTGEYEDALELRLWLWQHALEYDRSMVGVRGSFWVGDMTELAEAHPPARQAFDELRLELEDDVFAGQADFRELRDWLSLCQVVGADERTLDWYEQVRDDQGRLPWVARGAETRLYELLLERGRYADAGRVLQDVDREIRLQRATRSTMARIDMPEGVRTMADAMGDNRLRSKLAVQHAALLAAGRTDEARRVAETLLVELDDANSRLALVEAALDADVARAEHVTWFAQVDAMTVGATAVTLLEGFMPEPMRTPDLDVLRRRLEQADLVAAEDTAEDTAEDG